MKQEQFETIISLRKVFLQPTTKRVKKAIKEIKKFVLKHEKNSVPIISNEVNHKILSHSKNIPRKINAVLVKNKEKVTVYLKDGKQLAEDRKKAAEEAKAKEKKEKEQKKEEKTEEKEKEEKDKQEKEKLDQKRQREKATKSAELKKGRK